MIRRHLLLFTALIALFVLLPSDADAQCAMCKKVAEGDPNSANVKNAAAGLNPAILYLMSVPYFALMFIFRKQLKGLYVSWREKKKPS